MPFTILNLNVTVKIFEIYVHRLLNNVASFFISFRNVKASRLEMQGSRFEIQGSKARGSKYKARRLEGSKYKARGSTYRILKYRANQTDECAMKRVYGNSALFFIAVTG